MSNARYIAFEGPEGCGKSTHAKRLASRLDAVITREPGGTRIGTMLREVLANPDNTDMHARTEALLMAADRAQHVEEVVMPALTAGRHVVSDRSVYSTLAYQGYGRGLSLDSLRTVNDWALGGRLPDLVVYMQVPSDVLAQRLEKRDLDRFEREGEEFFQRVNAGFDALMAAEPTRWITIDGTLPKDDVEALIWERVSSRL
ncbi:MAG: dTMP kinase [Actinomycetota bacterium]